MIAADGQIRGEMLTEMHCALRLLSQSVGIKAPREQLGPNGTPLPPHLQDPESSVALEGGLVAAILQTAKGKKLMGRTIKLLEPEKRWALMPVILARILQSDPADQPQEEQAVEQKLMKTLRQFVNKSQEVFDKMHSEDGQGRGQGSLSFAATLVGHLRQCLKSVMVSHTEKHQLRKALLSSRPRAEIMHVIVQVTSLNYPLPLLLSFY